MLRESIRGDYREAELLARPEIRVRSIAEASFKSIQVRKLFSLFFG
jgi:hypothetical protein